MSASDRFQVVEQALMPPGVCRVCGGASKPWYIDFGLNEEYYGAVYFCSECIGAMANAAGFLTPAEKTRLEQRIEQLETELFETKVRADGLERGLDGLRSAGFLVSRDPGWADGGVPETPVSGAGSEQEAGDLVGTREGTSAEPSDEPGVADVRSSGGVEEPVSEFRFTV
jgi:hypothetical protein